MFSAIYLYLKEKNVDPEVDEDKWKIVFGVPTDEMDELYPIDDGVKISDDDNFPISEVWIE